MPKDNPFLDVSTLDEVLLDVATLIELSPRDRRVAENRYRLLKQHLERSASPLAIYLVDGASKIYAQGSIATSTTIVSGTEDDRFDVDAIVEFDVPEDWSDDQALDTLEESLKGFPGAMRIRRCTRCVQIQFPFMHMDVTVLDRRHRVPVERAGEIFHSPDEGTAYRVPSNPWGFTGWFRAKVGVGQQSFTESLRRHRDFSSRSRLQILNEQERLVLAEAEQHDLPPVIPSALDAQEAVALKLLKRFINLHYESLTVKRPPSIYLTKRAADVGYMPQGLTTQLYALADSTAKILRHHLSQGTFPAEENPSYRKDRINDRWPGTGQEGRRNMQACVDAMERLTKTLEQMAHDSLSDIAKAIDNLFGERIGAEQRKVLAQRYDRRDGGESILLEPRTGTIKAPAIVAASPRLAEVPRHHFHPMILKKKRD